MNPLPGLVATVRNRRGLVAAVAAFDAGPEGRRHLVTVEYLDADGPAEDTLVWERERGELLPPAALPDPSGDPAMPLADFDALVRAARWAALRPYVDPDGSQGPLHRLPLAAPFHGAVQGLGLDEVAWLLRDCDRPRTDLHAERWRQR